MTLISEPAMIASDFSKYLSAKKLKKLAECPIDLTKEGILTAERLAKYSAESSNFKLLYATERIDEEVMHRLAELAHEARAMEKMERMQAGETVNYIQGIPSKNHPALHTASRDFFENPNKSKTADNAARLEKNEIEKLKAFIQKLDRENNFTEIIQIGAGGPDIGARAHYTALEYLLKPGRRAHFISNVDPDGVARILRYVDLRKSLVIVISKSGSTLETHTNAEILRSKYRDACLNPEEYFVAVTNEGSPIDDPAKYLECFHTWDWMGGRFSACSVAAGLLLSFCFGFDVYWEFLRGANAMDKASLNRDINKNLPLLGALLGIWNQNFLGYPTLAIIPYSQALIRYCAYIQHIDMESNGKLIDQYGQRVDFQTGPVIWGGAGTNSEHSFFQLIHQGTAVIPLEFIGFKHSQHGFDVEIEETTSQEKLLSNLFAQTIALALGQRSENLNKFFPGNRPSHILLAKQLNPYTLGNLLSYYENKVAFQGFIWGINSFDREGVELVKALSKKINNCFAVKKGNGKKEATEAYSLGDTFLKQLEMF